MTGVSSEKIRAMSHQVCPTFSWKCINGDFVYHKSYESKNGWKMKLLLKYGVPYVKAHFSGWYTS